MWEQSLSGLIKALRASKHDEDKVVQAALTDISSEVKSNDWDLKAGAVLKLTYLEMLGHAHLGQHAFQVIECMSCPRFHIKQVGYLAASQSFTQENQVLLLTNNLIKKDLSQNSAKQPVALLQTLGTLPTVLTSSAQLAQDLEPDLVRQLSHSRPSVRRAAVLVLGSVWRTSAAPSDAAVIERLGDKLLDEDPSVVNATVNVMLELARATPDRDPFLRLAPECFELLTTSSNNWMLIKIVKLFALLTPVEPRLVRKLLPPITNLISTTPAMSLLYECIHAAIAGGMLQNNDSLAKMCVTKLAAFLTDTDQNLRYIALLAINKLLPSHPHLISAYSSTILKSIDDSDSSIRSKALDLLEGMVDQQNLTQIVRKLLSQLTGQAAAQSASQHLSSPAAAALSSIAHANSSGSGPSASPSITSPAYKANLVSRILRILQLANYGYVTDFEWLVDLLIELAYISSTFTNASTLMQRQVGDVLVDVSARAKAIRPYAVSKCLQVLPDHVIEESAAWIVGEYCSEAWSVAIQTLAQVGRVHSAVKVLAKWAAEVGELWPDEEGGLESVKAQAEALRDLEAVQEAHELLALLTMMLANLSIDTTSSTPPSPPVGLSLLGSLYMPALNPVNPQAQSLVGLPDELDLDTWIVPGSIVDLPDPNVALMNDEVDEFGRPRGMFAPLSQDVGRDGRQSEKKEKKKGKKSKERSESEERRHKERKKAKRRAAQTGGEEDNVDDIPIVKLDMSELKPVTKPEQPAKPPPKPVFIDVDGELPPETLRRSPAPPNLASTTPAVSPAAAPAGEGAAALASGEPPQDIERTSTPGEESPTPVVVKKVKSKKKKSKT